MTLKSNKGSRFTLAFGGDEFDYSTFKLNKKALDITYLGSREHVEKGVHTVLYEFKTDGKTLLYANGKSTGTVVFVTLSEPPGQGIIDAQTARVEVLDVNTGKFLGVGRATLWPSK